jgi:hypothetical protein
MMEKIYPNHLQATLEVAVEFQTFSVLPLKLSPSIQFFTSRFQTQFQVHIMLYLLLMNVTSMAYLLGALYGPSQATTYIARGFLSRHLWPNCLHPSFSRDHTPAAQLSFHQLVHCAL